MRRVLRWLLNGLCLLSLLASVGVGWLWWRAGRTGQARVEVVAAHLDLEANAWPEGLSVRGIGRWPGGAGFWAGEGPDVAEIEAPQFEEQLRATRRLRLGEAMLECGSLTADLHRDGTPKRMTFREMIFDTNGFDVDRTGPLPFLSVFIPNPVAASLFALPPLLWLASRSRRLYVRRRRRRLGLCLRCGYDLRGNANGKCSECGEAVTAERRVTA